MSVPVKICGLTRLEDVERCLALRAGYVGFNFYRESPRHVTPQRARTLRDAALGRAVTVGVFVNASRDEVLAIDREVELDMLQFHGDEDPEFVCAFGRRAIAVLRPGEDFDAAVLAQLVGVGGWLFDCPHASLYGGSGESWDWSAVARLSAPTLRSLAPAERPRLFVAGGVRPESAQKAWHAASPGPDLAVEVILDVCSGVEASPGTKDASLLERLIQEIPHGEACDAP